MTNDNRMTDKDLLSYEDLNSFPDEDHEHLFSIVWKNWKAAREAEKRLEEEIEFLNKNYMDEDDKSLTLDAQLLKAKLIIKKLKAECVYLSQNMTEFQSKAEILEAENAALRQI